MPAAAAIPLRFPTDDAALLREALERFAQIMDQYTRDAPVSFVPRYQPIATINPPALVFGQVARVSLSDGDTLNMQLPFPSTKDYGKRCAVLRRTITGIVRIRAPGASIAGVTDYQMANDIHYLEFLLDDGAYFPTRPGSGIAL